MQSKEIKEGIENITKEHVSIESNQGYLKKN